MTFRVLALTSIAWLLPCSQAVRAAEPATTFTYLDASDGLPSQIVWAVTQDAEGFMWFGTSAGLVRYDGFEFTLYRNDPGNPRSLPGNEINALLMDRSGTVWIGATMGLARYVPGSDDFDRFPSDGNNPGSLAGNSVYALAEGLNGEIWVSTGALSRLVPRGSQFTRVSVDGVDPSANPVLSLHVDRAGSLWAGTYEAGLHVLSAGRTSFERVEIGPAAGAPRYPNHDTVYAIREDAFGEIWVGTGDGLNRIFSGTGTHQFIEFDEQQPDNPNAISGNAVYSILEDDRGNVWVGTAENGINRFDRASGEFRRYRADPADSRSPGSDLINSIYQDRSGLLWFAGRGISRLDLSSEALLIHEPPAGDPARIITDTRSNLPYVPPALEVDRDGLVWFGNSSGLVTLDRTDESWRTYQLVPDIPESSDNWVYSIHSGPDDWVYVGVPSSIALFLRARDGFGPSVISLRGTPYDIFVQDDGVIWASVIYDGLARLPGRNGEDQEYFSHDETDSSTLSSDLPTFLFEDSQGRFWVGTLNGLNRFDRATGTALRYPLGLRDGSGPGHAEVYDAAEASDGSLWFATGDGLSRLDPGGTTFEYFTTDDGLAHERVKTVEFDQQGFLWAGTEGGLSRLNVATRTIRNFRVQHGLPSDEVHELELGPDGELYIATHTGLVSLRPETLSAGAEATPEIGIVVAGAGSLPVFPGSADSDDGTGENVAPNGELTLTHRDRTLNLDLAVFDYRDPERNRYAYRLQGFDADWTYATGTQRRATYTSLPPGSYTFQFRGADSMGRWSDTVQSLRITVLPAPWLSPAAYTVYAVLAVLLFFGLVAWRTRSAVRRAEELQSVVDQRTREITEQRDTIEQQSEHLRVVASRKDRLYSNVSHEFRTPLTVILGPLERLLQSEHQPERRRHLEMIRRNARRLLRLVDQLMDLARLDAAKSVDPVPHPAGIRVQLLVESLRTWAEDQQVSIEADCDPAAWVRCDQDAMEKIVVNLLSNAVKYNRPGGRVTVVVRRLLEDRVEITVEDTGIGIAAELQPKIFDRFYRAPGLEEQRPGAGLGLALVHDLVEASSGTISLESEQGVGTRVTVTLPAAAAQAEPADSLEQVLAFDPDDEAALAVPAVSSADGRDDRPRALIIEDNIDLCRHLQDVLGGSLSMSVANDGNAGLAAAIDQLPDIVVCDVVLPGMNGLEVVRQIKQDDRTCHIPVILLTARAGEESRIAGLRALADDYLTKPFSEAELRQRMENLIAVRSILRQRFGTSLLQAEPSDIPADLLGDRDRRFMQRLDACLGANYHDPEFAVSGLASEVALSERQLQRKLKALTDHAPGEYLRNFRLTKAMAMLRTGSSIADVAFAVGFNSQSYFTSCFKARFGITPTEARESIRAKR